MRLLARTAACLMALVPLIGFTQTDESWNRPEPRTHSSLIDDFNAADRFLDDGNLAIERAQNAVPRFLDLAEVHVLRAVGRLSRSEQLTADMPYLIEHIRDFFNVSRKKEELGTRLQLVREKEEYLRGQIFAIRRDLEGYNRGGTIGAVDDFLSSAADQALAARQAGDEARARLLDQFEERLRRLLDSGNPDPAQIAALLEEMRAAGLDVLDIEIHTETLLQLQEEVAEYDDGPGPIGPTPPRPTPVTTPSAAVPPTDLSALLAALQQGGPDAVADLLRQFSQDNTKQAWANELASFLRALEQQGLAEPVQQSALELVLASDDPLATRDAIIETLRTPGLASFFSQLPGAGIDDATIRELLAAFVASDDPAALFDELRRLVEEEGLTLEAAIAQITGGTASTGRPSPENRVEVAFDDLPPGTELVVVDPNLSVEDVNQGMRRIYSDREGGFLVAEIDLRRRVFLDPANPEQAFVETEAVAERRYGFAISEVSTNRRRQDGQLQTVWQLVNRSSPRDTSFTATSWEVVNQNGEPVAAVEPNGERSVSVVFPAPGRYTLRVAGETEQGSPFTIELPNVDIQF